MTVAVVARALARLYPRSVGASDDLDRALGFVDAEVDPETVVRAGYGAALPATVAASLAGLVVGLPAVALPALSVAVGLGAAAAVHRLPSLAATLRRTRALGTAPALVGRVVLRMRVDPAVERAAAFAGATGTGALADSLADHVRRARGTPRTGIGTFADEWDDWFPALGRATGLVDAAASAPAHERDRTLDRALAAALDGTRDRVADFAAAVVGPTTALYAFGVLLPVALVGLLPALGVAGVPVSFAAFVVVYDVVLPAGLVVASAWLLVSRPVAFPPAHVDRSHPAVPDRRALACVAACVAGAAAWSVAGRTVATWAGPVAAVGAGTGAALIVVTRPVERVRKRARAIEANLDDALYLVGRRVADGEAVETALAAAADEVDGETGDLLTEAVGTGRRLGVDVRAAFLGDYGALADVPSPRARSAAALLAVAADTGRPAGEALVVLADHLGELRELEAEARRELARVTGTLRNTGAVFAPLVAGATVALAEGVRAAGTSGGAALGGGGAGVPGGAALGPAVGAYVLLLSATLTVLSTGLTDGLDRSLVGYRVGLAVPTATAAFLTSFAVASALV